MKPEEPSNSQSGLPLLPQRSILDTPAQNFNQPIRDATVNVLRSQIDGLFDTEKNQTIESVQPVISQIENINPYERTHAEHIDPQADQWKQYHTAWQTYYQKYYEGYYTHHLKKAIEETSTQKAALNKAEPLSNDEAIFDLRQKLLGKVSESAIKIRKSRHFMPLAAGLAVILIFLFLQYNRILIANVVAYVSPGNINPQNIVIDPNTTVVVNAEPRLIIPKINVDVPAIYGVGSDYDSQMAAMAKGVANFSIPGASSRPGQVGNTVLAGHSSNDLIDSGDYKFIFVQLDKLEVGDTVYANYQSTRYTYIVTKKEVVNPTDVSKLVYATDKPILTLLTCTPLGTSRYRLLVTAEQISPDPNKSIAAPVVVTKASNTSIPGSSPTLWERIFGSSN